MKRSAPCEQCGRPFKEHQIMKDNKGDLHWVCPEQKGTQR